MTQPLWDWSFGLSEFARGCIRYGMFILPTMVWVLHDLVFNSSHDAYVRVRDFYAWCWPNLFNDYERDPHGPKKNHDR